MATRTAKSSRTLAQLWRQGWHEIPEVMAATGCGLVGFALGGYMLHRNKKINIDNKRYKFNYIVVRPDDPRAGRIRKD